MFDSREDSNNSDVIAEPGFLEKNEDRRLYEQRQDAHTGRGHKPRRKAQTRRAAPPADKHITQELKAWGEQA